MKFCEMTDEQLDEWQKLYAKYFDAYDCWDADCYCPDELIFNDDDDEYDEILVCDHTMADECPMFEKWKMKETTPTGV